MADLIDNSNLVVLIYNGRLSPGLRWEFERLQSSAKDKTLFVTIDQKGAPVDTNKITMDNAVFRNEVHSLGTFYGYWFPDGSHPQPVLAKHKSWMISPRKDFESAIRNVIGRHPLLREKRARGPTAKSDLFWRFVQWVLPAALAAMLTYGYPGEFSVLVSVYPLWLIFLLVVYFVVGIVGAYVGLSVFYKPSEPSID